MDQPLFGEQKKGTQAFQYLTGFIVVSFTLVTAVCAAVKGKDDPKKFALAITALVTFGNLALLTWWYRDKEDRLHPKFKYLMVTLVLLVILVNSTSMIFIFYEPPGCQPLPLCPGGLLQPFASATTPPTMTYSCIGISDLTNCTSDTTGNSCIRISGSSGQCFGNCTVNAAANAARALLTNRNYPLKWN